MPDWNKLRDEFPITKKYAYLANASIAPITMPVYNEVTRFYQDVLTHGQTLWDEWETKMEQTRNLDAKFIGADSREEIAFTHSTSEGMNIIAHMLSAKGMVISNELEFPSFNLPWLNKDKDNIKFVKATDDNKIVIEDIAKMVNHNSKTKTLVSSHVQYSTGFRQDLKELGRLIIAVVFVLAFYSMKITEFVLFLSKGSHSVYGLNEEHYHVVITSATTSNGSNIGDLHSNNTIASSAMNMKSSSMTSTGNGF